MSKIKTIIILDDSEVILAVLRNALQKSGINNAIFFNDSYNFKFYFDDKVELAIIDHHIDQYTYGYDIISHIRGINKNCRIIIITSTKSAATVAKYSGQVERIILKQGQWVNEIVEIIHTMKRDKNWFRLILDYLYLGVKYLLSKTK